MAAVKVQFQIGHTSKLRSKKTVEGFTHDWELYVKGVQQADISSFIEKIIFNLHESFQKPKRVCNKPPYVIQESGYAGFLVFIDIYFRNRDEPKKVQFSYDLDLQTTGPPQHRHEIKTFIFDNPSEEYRQKLLKGGGVPVSGVVAGSQPTIHNNNIIAMPGAISLNHSPGDGHKSLTVGEGKKHKLRPDDTRSNSFTNVFGTPITKTSAVVATGVNKHSPDNKTLVAAVHASHQSTASASLPAAKEKSSKDKDKPSEKSKERSEKREKHHKQSLTSPNKEGRSESKKSEGGKHEKRDKTEEKSRKDKNRDKDRERERDKSSGTNVSASSAIRRPTSPKPVREHSPHKSMAAGIMPTNTAVNNTNSVARPASSNSGKLEDTKQVTKSSTGESKSKDSKQKESSSSSGGKKSKKEKKDKDKERDKEKRHEEKEKLKLTESQQRTTVKEDSKMSNMNTQTTTNTNSLDNKNPKLSTNSLSSSVPNDVSKKPEKLTKQDFFKTNNDKTTLNNVVLPPPIPMATSSNHSSSEKKSTSSSSLNSNSNPSEKDKRSHKHKKKEKNKDKDKDKDKEKDKDREKDKERDKEKDKERDKDKDKEKDKEKEKEKDKDMKREKDAKEKHPEEKSTELLSSGQENPNATKVLLSAPANAAEQQSVSIAASASNLSITTTNAALYTSTAIPSSISSSSSAKSSKNKEKKSKDKSSSKEEKFKHKTNDMDTNEPKVKQPKLSSSNSSSSVVSTSVVNTTTNSTQPTFTTAPNIATETNLNSDINDNDSFPAATTQKVSQLPNDTSTKTSLQPSPIITHSDSSNSSFPDLPLPKQQPPYKQPTSHERSKTFSAPAAVAPLPISNAAPKDPPKNIKPTAKEKQSDKPPKEDEKEKKKRRNSQAVNTFIEPPLKQLKTKEHPKSLREKSKSPSLRNTGSRASISADTSTTFLQPSASPSSTAAAAPLPPPSSASSAAHSPALSATEAVGNATSATANAATCNSNSTPSSTTNSTSMAAPHHLPLDYLTELQELHHKIMTLQDNEDLQHVVELIAATGCYEITTKTFDFDLCKLDRGTVQRLQEFFATSVS